MTALLQVLVVLIVLALVVVSVAWLLGKAIQLRQE